MDAAVLQDRLSEVTRKPLKGFLRPTQPLFSSAGIERARKCLQGEHFVRCCHSTYSLLFSGFRGSSGGGLQQFATQTLPSIGYLLAIETCSIQPLMALCASTHTGMLRDSWQLRPWPSSHPAAWRWRRQIGKSDSTQSAPQRVVRVSYTTKSLRLLAVGVLQA